MSWDRRILVVDDNPDNTMLLRELLSFAGYREIRTENDSGVAFSTIIDWDPDLVILDLHMPGLSGFDILERIKENLTQGHFLPILACTADWTETTRKRALELGASDFITKPFDATELLLRVGNFLRMRQMHLQLASHNRHLETVVERRTRSLVTARTEALECLARAGEYRDDATGEHVRRVAEMSARIARELGLNEATIQLLLAAAPLHDLGKIGISDRILMKPGKLTDDEFADMRRHAEVGALIIGQVKSPVLRKARQIAMHHHEHWDGSGYPSGLSGREIPLLARIVSVADMYDALVNARPYKPAWPVSKAVEEIRRHRGTRFDPDVVDAFSNVMRGQGIGIESERDTTDSSDGFLSKWA